MEEKKMRDRLESHSVKNIKEVVIGSAIRYIDNWAFGNCDSLKKVVIGQNVEEIGRKAFSSLRGKVPAEIVVHPQNTHFYMEDNCLIETKTGRLKLCIDTPRITDSVRCVELNNAFQQGDVFEELYIGKSLEKLEIGETCRSCGFKRIVLHPDNQHFEVIDNCLFYRNGTELLIGGIDCVIPEKTTKICSHAFYRSEKGALLHITIPKNVVTIEEFAFAYAGIQSLRIPGSVVSIARSAFFGCRNLRTVEFEHGLKQIKDQAFCATGIEALHLPDSVETVEENAFASCSHLKTVTSLGSIKKISDSLFRGCKVLENVVLPPTLQTIERCAFTECALKSIELHDGITKIEEHAFNRCANLETVIMSDSVKDMGEDDTFGDCKALKELRLSNSIHTIPLRAFRRCENLRKITLPPSVKRLDDQCFLNCTALESINIEHLAKIARDTFEGCDKLPAEMKRLPKTKKKAAIKSLIPDDLWSIYTAEEYASEFSINEDLWFYTMSNNRFCVTFHGGYEYDNECYLLLSHQEQLFFLDTEDEYDEEEKKLGNYHYHATVYSKDHPLFPDLKAAYEKECEECEAESLFAAATESFPPSELWAPGTAEELIEKTDGKDEDDKNLWFMTTNYRTFELTFNSVIEYENDTYLLVSKQGLLFFIFIRDEHEEHEVFGKHYRTSVYDKKHPLFPYLKTAYMLKCEEDGCKSVFNIQ